MTDYDSVMSVTGRRSSEMTSVTSSSSKKKRKPIFPQLQIREIIVRAPLAVVVESDGPR